MIAQLFGKIVFRSATQSVIDCSGVGYEVFHTPFTSEKLRADEAVRLFIHSHIREDAFTLFGFFSTEERELFRELLKVNAVGPKLALSILSGISTEELIAAVERRDHSRLQKIPGIGKKTAERLVMELSDRLAKMNMGLPELGASVITSATVSSGTQKELEVESVLLHLGYQRAEISRALRQIKLREPDLSDLPLENLVKVSLRELGSSGVKGSA